MHAPKPRTGMPGPKLDQAEFRRRYLGQFRDPAFDPLRDALDQVADGVRRMRDGMQIDAGAHLKAPREKWPVIPAGAAIACIALAA